MKKKNIKVTRIERHIVNSELKKVIDQNSVPELISEETTLTICQKKDGGNWEMVDVPYKRLKKYESGRLP